MTDQNASLDGRRRWLRISIRVLMVIVLISGLIFGLVEHRIRQRRAEYAYNNAKASRIVAEIALAEYVEGIYKQDAERFNRELSAVVSSVFHPCLIRG